MAKLGSSLKSTPSPSKGRRLGSAVSTEGASPVEAEIIQQPNSAAATLSQRLEDATLQGALTTIPAAYEDGRDWETILSDDVFAQLYLAAHLHEKITDAHIVANHKILSSFWERKRLLLITGNKGLEEVYGPGTITRSADKLDNAAYALKDAKSRHLCFEELGKRRRSKASADMSSYMRHALANQLMLPSAIKLAVNEGIAKGFEPSEAEDYLVSALRESGFAPVKTVNQNPNLLLSTWTPGGQPLTGRAHTKVMGQDVYSLDEAAQLLQEGLIAGDEKAARNLDSEDYLTKVALDLKENDAMMDIREIMVNSKLNRTQKRLSVLYLMGPGLPFYADNLKEAFSNPSLFFLRTATLAKDFYAAEEAFKAGNLQIWLRAAATAEVKTAIPAKATALDFRNFMHNAKPKFPLWVGENHFSTPELLANYIKKDETTWKMVYGSFSLGFLSPWLNSLGQTGILTKQDQLAKALAATEWENTSEMKMKIHIQALLEALDPQCPTPALELDLDRLDLTGLSGETAINRVLTIKNNNGGYVRALLSLQPQLDGVSISEKELFFDQRAPGQQIQVTITGYPDLMPRNGQNLSNLSIRTAYNLMEVPVIAESVFPWKEFLKFVGIGAVTLAVILGSIRFLLEVALTDSLYQTLLSQQALLPLSEASKAGDGPGFLLILILVLLVSLLYGFIWSLIKIAQSKLL